MTATIPFHSFIANQNNDSPNWWNRYGSEILSPRSLSSIPALLLPWNQSAQRWRRPNNNQDYARFLWVPNSWGTPFTQLFISTIRGHPKLTETGTFANCLNHFIFPLFLYHLKRVEPENIEHWWDAVLCKWFISSWDVKNIPWNLSNPLLFCMEFSIVLYGILIGLPGILYLFWYFPAVH